MIAESDDTLTLCGDSRYGVPKSYSEVLGEVRTQGPVMRNFICDRLKDCTIDLLTKLDIVPNYISHSLKVGTACTPYVVPLSVPNLDPDAEFVKVTGAAERDREATIILQFIVHSEKVDIIPHGSKLCWCGAPVGLDCRLDEYIEIGTIESECKLIKI